MTDAPFDREFSALPEKSSFGGPIYVEAMPTSQMAIVSYIFGVPAYVVLPMVGAPIAIIAGHIALGRGMWMK